MRKLTVNTFLTLDGVMQAPGGPEEDPSDGFRFGGWSAPLWDHGMDEVMGGVMGEPFDLLLGRRTYEIFAAHWPHADERAARGGDESGVDDEAAAALNSARKYVASRTLDRVDWNNSVLLEGDVVEAVAELKRQPGPEIQVHGSADLLQTLLRSDLVDELSLFTFPVVVGHGKRLFTDGAAPTGMKVVDAKVFGTGVVWARYAREGNVDTGSFAFEDPTPAEAERRAKLAAE
jgi:dihydrofolate reductase